MTLVPNPTVDLAITQSMRAANSAASRADQTCDPRAAKLHMVANMLQDLLFATNPDLPDAAAIPSAGLEKTP